MIAWLVYHATETSFGIALGSHGRTVSERLKGATFLGTVVEYARIVGRSRVSFWRCPGVRVVTGMLPWREHSVLIAIIVTPVRKSVPA